MKDILGRHRILGQIWLAVSIGGIFWIIRHKGDFRSWTPGLNLIAVIVLTLPLIQICLYQSREFKTKEVTSGTENAFKLHLSQGSSAQDIYYIIVDAYGRDDILQEMYELDNTPFLQRLADLGFYVAQCLAGQK